MRVAFLIAVCLAVASCVPAKATVDYTMSEGIIWPGEPEKPRIKYLWSLQRISGGEGASRVLRYITGEEDIESMEDPRRSNFLVRPHGLYLDGGQRLYIADPGAMRVTVVDLKSMESFNIDSAGEVRLVSPIGVVADTGGRIYVTDAELKAVLVFNGKGKFLRLIEGDFQRPTGLAINNVEGLLYVADTWGHVIYIYDLEGSQAGMIGERGEGPGMLNYPTHIAVDMDGFLYVSDTLNFKIHVFTGHGRLVNSFGLIGDTYDTFDKIKGIAVDSGGHIYIADSAQDMVKVYDRQGNLLLFFGSKGDFYGNFSLPTGVFVDGEDRILVSDALNRRVQAFRYVGEE